MSKELSNLNDLKEFTQTTVLFSMSGHVFIREDAPEEYRQRSLKEIKEDALYIHVMSSVPYNMKRSLWEMYDDSTKDVDPIVGRYLRAQFPVLAQFLDKTKGFNVRESWHFLEQACLTNENLTIRPIGFDELVSIANEVNEETEKKEFFVK